MPCVLLSYSWVSLRAIDVKGLIYFYHITPLIIRSAKYKLRPYKAPQTSPIPVQTKGRQAQNLC